MNTTKNSIITSTLFMLVILLVGCVAKPKPPAPDPGPTPDPTPTPIPIPDPNPGDQTNFELDSFFFGYANDTKADANIMGMAKKTDPKKDYRYKVVNDVLADLIIARGDFRLQEPTLVFSHRKKYLAYMNSRTVEIGFEAEAYELCREMGADSLNAIAALIGHEVTHYYEKHHWIKHFADEHQDMETAKTLNNQGKIEKVRTETQADEIGGFLGYSAGYNTLGVMPKVLRKLYAGYGLPDVIPGYPTLQEREEIANESMAKLETLANMYDMANYLTAIGEYSSAATYYKEVLKTFQSREIHNNVGVLAFLESLNYFEDDDLKYGYPIELDSKSRFSTNTKGMADDKVTERKILLKSAIKSFNKAINLDPNYATAQLNLACATALLSTTDDDVDSFEAISAALKAKKLATSQGLTKVESDVYVLQGILADLDKDEDETKRLFAKAKDMGNELAEMNHHIALTGNAPKGEKEPIGFGVRPEKIDDIQINSFMNNPGDHYFPDKDDRAVELSDKNTTLFVIKKPNSKIYYSQTKDGTYIGVFVTNDGYSGQTSKGIKVGSVSNDVTSGDNYGASGKNIETPNGRYMIYPKKNLMFITELDSNEKMVVKKWATYKIDRSE